MIGETVGVIGLGTMGGRIAGHLAGSGVTTLGFDVLAPIEPPPGVEVCADVAAVVERATTVLFSLPDGAAVLACVADIVAAPRRRAEIVVDLSTIGMAAAQDAASRLEGVGIGYVDSPVSGTIAAAASGQLSLMVAAPDDLFERAEPVLGRVGRQVSHIGREAGLGQAMKVINNAISGTTLAVTSEALAVGLDLGLDLGRMLDVVNASSGRSVASDRKFPEQVLTGRYAYGGPGSHFQKDIGLFVDIARTTGRPHRLAAESADLWSEFATSWRGADQTEIFRYLRDETRDDPPGDPAARRV